MMKKGLTNKQAQNYSFYVGANLSATFLGRHDRAFGESAALANKFFIAHYARGIGVIGRANSLLKSASQHILFLGQLYHK